MKKFFYKFIHIYLAKKRTLILSFIARNYYRFIFNPLIIRENTSDIKVFRSIFILKEFDLPIDIKPKLIVDAGAYTGLSALFFSRKYPNAKIIAVEPEDSNFEILKQNTSQFKNVELVKSGLWSKNAYLKVIDNNLGKWAFSLKEVDSTSNYDLQATTVDDILKNSPFDRIDILKIDIEGAEKEIFKDNYNSWLEKVNIIFIELHDRYLEGCSEAVYNAIDLNLWNEYKKGEKVIFIRKNIKDLSE